MCVCIYTVLCYSCSFLGPETQGRAAYPPVAPKPSAVRMATGGAGPEEVGQGSPVVMKKMVPVQSSRPQPAGMAQQGETQLRPLNRSSRGTPNISQI